MPLTFSYDSRKATSNLRKHGVSFAEAETVFLDPLAVTVPDEAHSADEIVNTPLVILNFKECSLWCILNLSMAKSASSAPAKPTRTSAASTRSSKPKRVRLDFSKGVVGKYYEAAMQAKQTIVLDRDLLDTFPNAEAVNAALRSLKEIATRTRKPPAPAKRPKPKAA